MEGRSQSAAALGRRCLAGAARRDAERHRGGAGSSRADYADAETNRQDAALQGAAFQGPVFRAAVFPDSHRAEAEINPAGSEAPSAERPFHNGIVHRRPNLRDRLVRAGRMNPVRQQRDVDVPIRIDPE